MEDAAETKRIAEKTGFSADAVSAMADAIRSGAGTMAQFSHPELGGFGQWSQGGMLMIGDMFNNGLKARVSSLAEEIAEAVAQGRLTRRPSAVCNAGSAGGSQWWPETLGRPSSSGAQNGMRYAVFPDVARLAVDAGGKVTVYDTGEHSISGVSQQQSGSTSLRFSSQIGSVEPHDLGVVPTGGGKTAGQDGAEDSADEATERAAPSDGSAEDDRAEAGVTSQGSQGRQPAWASSSDTERPKTAKDAERRGDPLDMLRRLADLKNEGILSNEEFSAKKAELLARI